jgi:hypothetical protein
METNSIGPEYFHVLDLPLIKGRPFLSSDAYGQPCVAILNETGAQAVWGDQKPVGRTIDLHVSGPDHEYCQVIGEVRDARFIKLDEPPGPEIYFSRLQKPRLTPALMVRTAGNPLAMANVILGRIAGIPGGQRVIQIFSIDQLIERSALQPRFRAALLSIFAGLALVIAAIGVYGVMVFFVSMRNKEIGIRMALGAQRREVVGMVVGRAMLLSTIGLSIGLVLSLALSRGTAGLLYGVRSSDPRILAGVGGVLLSVALFASWLPARRGTRIDLVKTLRQE